MLEPVAILFRLYRNANLLKWVSIINAVRLLFFLSFTLSVLQVYTIFYPHIACYGRRSPTCPIPSPTDKTQSLLPRRRNSGNSNSLPLPLFSFYWHCVLIVMIVLDSLFLVENWMDLAQALWRYHTTYVVHWRVH